LMNAIIINSKQKSFVEESFWRFLETKGKNFLASLSDCIESQLFGRFTWGEVVMILEKSKLALNRTVGLSVGSFIGQFDSFDPHEVNHLILWVSHRDC